MEFSMPAVWSVYAKGLAIGAGVAVCLWLAWSRLTTEGGQVIHDDLVKLVQDVAAEEQIPWELLYAICMTESSGNEFAIRYEPNYKWLLGANISNAERLGQKTSWGLCQVMGAVAREYGYTDQFSGLWDPRTNLKYGVKHIKRLKAKHGSWPPAIASYNAGTPVLVDGKYKNQGYVDKVLARWSSVETQTPLKASEA